jgi:hypothetical protein
MISYLLLRLQSTGLVVLFATVSLFLISKILFPVDPFIYVLVSFSFFLVGLKSNWCLILPLSRLKLSLLQPFEAFVFACLSALFVATSYFSSPNVGEKYVLNLIEFVFWMTFLIRYAITFKPERQGTVRVGKLTRKAIVRLLLIAAVVFIHFGYTHQFNFITLVLFAAFLASVPFFPFFQATFPIQTLKEIRKIWGATCLSAGIALAVFSVMYTCFLPPGSRTELALKFWKGLPLQIEPARAFEIMRSPDVNIVMAKNSLLAPHIKNMPIEQMVDRAKSCATIECLDTTTDLALERNDVQKFEVLKVFMQKAKDPVIKKTETHSRIVILNEKWAAELLTSPTIDVWLKSNDPSLQIFAIKSLSGAGANPTQLKTVQELQRSSNQEVRNAAYLQVDKYQEKALKRADKCKQKPKKCEYRLVPAFDPDSEI